MPKVVATVRVVLLVLAGVVVGVAAVAVHGLTTGLVLALVATAAAAHALPGGWSWRLPFGVGWCAVVLVTAQPRGSGSYLIAGDIRGYTLVGGAVALLLFCVVTVVPRRSRAAAEPGTDETVS